MNQLFIIPLNFLKALRQRTRSSYEFVSIIFPVKRCLKQSNALTASTPNSNSTVMVEYNPVLIIGGVVKSKSFTISDDRSSPPKSGTLSLLHQIIDFENFNVLANKISDKNTCES